MRTNKTQAVQGELILKGDAPQGATVEREVEGVTRIDMYKAAVSAVSATEGAQGKIASAGIMARKFYGNHKDMVADKENFILQGIIPGLRSDFKRFLTMKGIPKKDGEKGKEFDRMDAAQLRAYWPEKLVMKGTGADIRAYWEPIKRPATGSRDNMWRRILESAFPEECAAAKEKAAKDGKESRVKAAKENGIDLKKGKDDAVRINAVLAALIARIQKADEASFDTAKVIAALKAVTVLVNKQV